LAFSRSPRLGPTSLGFQLIALAWRNVAWLQLIAPVCPTPLGFPLSPRLGPNAACLTLIAPPRLAPAPHPPLIGRPAASGAERRETRISVHQGDINRDFHGVLAGGSRASAVLVVKA
jgi:hypothetical protein